MNNEKKTVIKCWSCGKKFTTSSVANPPITIYRGFEPSAGFSPEKKRLLKTCPYCSKENLIEV